MMNKTSLIKDLEFKNNKSSEQVLSISSNREARAPVTKEQLRKKHEMSFPVVTEVVENVIIFGVNGEIHPRFQQKSGTDI